MGGGYSEKKTGKENKIYLTKNHREKRKRKERPFVHIRYGQQKGMSRRLNPDIKTSVTTERPYHEGENGSKLSGTRRKRDVKAFGGDRAPVTRERPGS